jgi:FlaG/FlaF family flagellin (archaellin)
MKPSPTGGSMHHRLTRSLPIFLALLISLTILLAPVPATVVAEGIAGQLSASSTSVAAGSTVTITFSAVPAVNVSAYQVNVNFDTAKFEYVSGQDLTGLNGGNSIDNNGGSIGVFAYGDTDVPNISRLCRLTFRAKAEGEAVFSSSGAVINSQNPPDSAVKVAVTPPGATAETPMPTNAATTAATTPTEATLELTSGTFTVVPIPDSLQTPTGFYRTAVAVGGLQMEAFKSSKGDMILLYLDNDFAGTQLYFYDSLSNSVYPYTPFQVPGHTFGLIRPDSSAIVPAGFSSTSITLDGQLISCWKKETATDPEDPYHEVYLLYLLDEQGQKGFFLYKPSTQMIFPFVMIDAQKTDAPNVTPPVTETGPAETSAEADGDETTQESRFDLWRILAMLLGGLSLVLIGFLVWTYIEYVRPVERAQQAGLPQAPPKPPKIRRVD